MPSATVTFETNEPSLGDYLRQIEIGAIQLPDFQRDWVWGDVAIRQLIASVTRAYPIGAVMLLETGGEGSNFLPRLFEGVEDHSPNLPSPERLVLDGQQRLTSLFLSLVSTAPVATRTENKDRVDRFYYLDMAGCLDPDTDRYDAVVSVPDTKTITSDFGRKIDLDLRTSRNEYENGMFPLNCTFSSFYEWAAGFRKHFNYDPAKCAFVDRFQELIWHPITNYKLPVIELKKETSKEAVCQVFENVNTGGVTLTAFEIVTATFAADGFRLRDDWAHRRERLHESHPVLRGVGGSEFLQAVTLVASYRRDGAVSVRRRDVLALKLSEYEDYAGNVERGLERAARLLNLEKIFDQRNLPYGTQFIPLAAVCAELGDRFDESTVREKLARWYWCGVFGEMYGGANETRYAMDMQDLLAWTLEDAGEPRTVRDAEFAPMRLLSLRTRQSAAYKGLFALMMQKGGNYMRESHST